MASIRIPRLQQAQSTRPTQTDRLNVNVKDQSSTILNRTQQLTSLANQGGDIYQKYENDKINQLNNEVEQSYNAWNTQQLRELRKVKGDPTDAYIKYEAAEKEKYQELLSERPDLNERVKRHVTSNLSKVQDSYRMKVLKQRGMQVETYKNNLFNSTVKLKKDTLPTNASFVTKGDQGSYLQFDQNIADIKTTIAQRGLENGTAKVLPDDAKSWSHIYRDGDGKLVKVSMDNTAKQKAAKELGEGVSTSINAMIDSGEKERAELVYDRYKGYIDPKTNGQILKKFDKENKRDDAFKIVGEIEAKPKVDQTNAIDKIKDPETKSEALKILSTNNARRERLKKQSQDSNYDLLLKTVDSMKEKNRINGISDLESSPVYKSTWDKLSRNQQKAIEQEFNAPKKSDSKQVVKIQDAIFKGEINRDQFRSLLVDINTNDRNKYLKQYDNMEQKKNASFTRILAKGEKMLKRKLLIDGSIDANTAKSSKKLQIANDDLLEYLEGAPANLSDDQLNDHINDFAKKLKKIEIFGGSGTGGFFGFGGEDAPTRVTDRAFPEKQATLDPGTVLKGLNGKDIFAFQKKFKREKNLVVPPAPNNQEFLKYVKGLR